MDVAFLLIFFLLLSSNFILQPGISVSLPFSRFTLGPQTNQQIISITGGASSGDLFPGSKITLEQLGPLLDAAKREGHSIIIRADRLTPYETVIEVTNAALEHGITSVALATTSSAMNASVSGLAVEPLLFSWEPPRRRRSQRLPLFWRFP